MKTQPIMRTLFFAVSTVAMVQSCKALPVFRMPLILQACWPAVSSELDPQTRRAYVRQFKQQLEKQEGNKEKDKRLGTLPQQNVSKKVKTD